MSFVCETLSNRVLRFYVGKQGNFMFTVFYQFSGRLGPTAISANKEDYLFVARYEFMGRLNRDRERRGNLHHQPEGPICALANFTELPGTQRPPVLEVS